MKLISSYDSYPIENNRWGLGNKFEDTLIMTSLSLLYASQHYDVTFYTTAKMKKILNFLPVNIEVFNKKFNYLEDTWVESKFYAMSKQTKPFIHIDTDVFLYKEIFNKYKNSPVIIERPEMGEDFHPHYPPQLSFWNDYVVKDHQKWDKNLNYSFNCGTLGFNDMNLKDDFLKSYYNLKEGFFKNKKIYRTYKKKGSEPCIMLEQYNLASLCKKSNIKVDFILPYSNRKSQSEAAKQIGYTHLSGNVKYDEDIIKRIHQRFKTTFPSQYKKLQNRINKFLKT
jgi:hypothetical protein